MVKNQDFSGSNDSWLGSYGPIIIGVNLRNLCYFLQEELLCQL